MTLAGYRIPSAVPNTLTLNFEGGANDIPTYSFADLRACVERNNAGFFPARVRRQGRHLRELLDSGRQEIHLEALCHRARRSHATALRSATDEAEPARFKRNSIAGVYIHATAVQNLISRDAVVELGRWPTTMIAIVFAGLVALAARC